ncbi:MAG: 2-C-methyl-D-erythritol 2,4-cyclodiphosphate synthase [Acidimicrobiaceae bacterium]|nr:2-C-methyl-D-erythritol 2,4-cyclodiphosphate synthase [Acidimicrobiaceae bacterium]|tara:strand:+ start:5142 stop:5612 length:471 start_codon:yes stop_codon:yes gene_type:complete
MMRVGHGFDSHAYITDQERPLILGGVTFESDLALQGHSDSDVVTHACIDSILSPVGLGDIGTLFPDNDPKYLNANSLELLQHSVELINDAGWDIVNIDCSIIADIPKIQPSRSLIETTLSKIVQAPVTVKGKTPEGLLNFNGVACFAVCLLKNSNA